MAHKYPPRKRTWVDTALDVLLIVSLIALGLYVFGNPPYPERSSRSHLGNSSGDPPRSK
jgi:hypothetical protein